MEESDECCAPRTLGKHRPKRQLYCDTKIKPYNLSLNYFLQYCAKVSVCEFYLVLVSEFYLLSVPDILYGRLRDFYTILNCVGTQKLNLRVCRMRDCQ